MSKIIQYEIKQCFQCRFCYIPKVQEPPDTLPRCDKMPNKVMTMGDIEVIPDWCPLPEG